MPKKLSQSAVIARFKNLYGDLYDYSNTVYVNSKTSIDVYCTKHHIHFYPNPDDHWAGHRCPMCGKESTKKIIYGFGFDDTIYNHKTKAHRVWQSMINRCYNPNFHQREKSYINCTVCEEWRYFSNFKKWFDENYKEGCHLDKDILVKGNKVYSPETCCFVPREINNLFVLRGNDRGNYPIGVSLVCGKYHATLSVRNNRIHLGTYATPEEAFYAYKERKEQHVKELAEKYYKEGKITERVYLALLNYRVEITD